MNDSNKIAVPRNLKVREFFIILILKK